MTGAPILQPDVLMRNYAPRLASFVRGEGSILYDEDGKAHLDFLGGLAVTSLGHAHPEVAAAICHQAQTLLHTSNYFLNPIAVEVAGTIDRLLGGGGRVLFCNSGAEASEIAIKLARKWAGAPAGRYVTVSTYGSFHGRTMGALAATGQPSKHEPFAPMLEGFRHVALGDLDALDAAIDPSTAGLYFEPLQGEGGVWPAPLDWATTAERLCRERGALLMLDEVQTGLGRTGRWFGYEHLGIQPDVVTLAKALGNGMPIGAVWARADVADAFEPGDHGATYGGQPLATAAARAVLAVMEREDVPAKAEAAGARLRAGLEAIPAVRSVRGWGLLLATELGEGADAKAVMLGCLERGLIVNAITATALRLAPQLLVTDDEIDEAIHIVAEALK